jgi:hypothetical protein
MVVQLDLPFTFKILRSYNPCIREVILVGLADGQHPVNNVTHAQLLNSLSHSACCRCVDRGVPQLSEIINYFNNNGNNISNKLLPL